MISNNNSNKQKTLSEQSFVMGQDLLGHKMALYIFKRPTGGAWQQEYCGRKTWSQAQVWMFLNPGERLFLSGL